MKIQGVGHVVLKVRDLDRSVVGRAPDAPNPPVDGDPAIWAEDPTTVATSKPLTLG